MCSITPATRLTLQMDAQAPSAARRFIQEASCPAHNASVLDDALLLISELVTNAVRYGAPPVTAEIECVGTAGMRVRVTDGSTQEPAPKHADVLDENGRGLELVDLVSAEWGVEQRAPGKAVWFALQPT
jgi:anti-sigma regulatory factor (Ser/Thr protein kinase)